VGACIQAANAVYDEKTNGYTEEINAFGKCFDTADMKEGTTAFLEKRKANFIGK
jgi:enoyl-CoA hydratase